ncbi:response regulator [Pseudomaricurvus sp.]|uniref:response regulator n=1 Tax=Pseudomaricurvus sp. TaxID=2004510 RepID=UPI003F6CCEB9
MNILLVEDDLDLASGLVKALRHEGFTVNHVTRGREAVLSVKAEPPDMVVLDLGLPDIDGLQVLKAIRSGRRSLPVLILTARDGLDDKVVALDTGADDYLSKPFEMEELLARLRVVARRLGTSQNSKIELHGVSLDTRHHQVLVNDLPIKLSRREYMLLMALMENSGRVQTKEMLEQKLYGWGEEVVSNAIEVHISNIRKKLPADFIKTVRGVGYSISKLRS